MDQEISAQTQEHVTTSDRVVDSIHAVDVGLKKERAAFHRLPLDVIQKILYTVDANTFASLTVLNQQWRGASNNAELYAHQISQCPLFAISSSITGNSIQNQDLNDLKRKFAREIRRNAFDVFLRPRTTHVTLISSSAGSSTALPIGEALKFSFSANGHILLCLSSSRICVLDLASPLLKVLYELKTTRMPLAATILDSGRVLAVVSHRHQVNIYHLSHCEAKHVQVLTLNDVPRTLALAPNGNVLGIAYEGGIEVYAIGENVLSTQRRAVRCEQVDELSFSPDGSLLLGTSLDCPGKGFVTITAPFPSDSMVDVSDYLTQIWTTQILFPDLVPGYGHVTSVSNHVGDDDNWIIGFDNTLKTFRAVRSNDPRNGVVYFPGPVAPGGLLEYTPSLIPAIDPDGELVALAFHGSGLWLYGIPDDMNQTPPKNNGTIQVNGTVRSRQSEQSSPSSDHDETVVGRLRRTINRPSLMIQGHKIADIPGLTAARWVAQQDSSNEVASNRHRLVAVAPGGVTSASLGDEAIPVDGGRVSIFDFEPSTKDGNIVDLTIELGEAEPLILREPNANLEQEVELERRRTQLHRRVVGSPRVNPRDRPTASRQSFPARSNSQKQNFGNQRGSRSQAGSPVSDRAVGDVTLFLDGPYSNTAPRSGDTLRRAATAAASNRRPQYQAREQARPVLPVLQIPHESDADNWVPPPPPYSRNADGPLPDHLRQLLLPTMTAPPGGVMEEFPQTIRRVHTNQGTQQERTSSNFLSRRWSTRRPTTNEGTSRRRMSFRQSTVSQPTPPSSHQPQRSPHQRTSSSISLSGNALQARLNHPVPPLPPVPPVPPISVLVPPVAHARTELPPSSHSQQSPAQTPSSNRPVSSADTQRRQSRSSRLFSGGFRKSNKNVPPNSDLARNGSIARHSAFSRSSPNLAFGRSAIHRMSTIYSSSSRPGEQNGVSRTRSRSETLHPPARLTESALRNAIQNQPGQGNQLGRSQPRRFHAQVPENPAPEEPVWQNPSSSETEAWRARIAEWNQNTINERRRSKGKSSRCIVM
ncbi:F-box domain protein [Talaromyces proteolyticus]|uniref:F-box domain protein n=1 Tax=Talaromyces proteolyticus TaxID=1131652 RepID=A0AAD4KJD2_9EURO|nr:F-box domain protein [Talaromyces proteolyticus]KAH8693825.1 F-box domain protein [Talaromyces proteolyticus]